LVCDIKNIDCLDFLDSTDQTFDLTYLDPPFNQNKEYNSHNDNMDPIEYWNWMENICKNIFDKTSEGGAIYFMQREKNVKEVLLTLEKTGWSFQNLIIWKKKSSAVPGAYKFGKHYQVIVFATKSNKPRVFNKLRIDPPLLVTEKYKRPTGMYVTDVWDDIRELTSGYFAGDEPLRISKTERLHNQQSPISLILRIMLSSTLPGDFVFDPFAGTATTNIVAKQIGRNSIGVEKDELYFKYCLKRINDLRDIDNVSRFMNEYKYTENLNEIWGSIEINEFNAPQYALFEKKVAYKRSSKK